MEYILGETVQHRIDRGGSFEAEEIITIGSQLAEALTAAHAVGLIHRDVKPSNILIQSGPRLRSKLTDFGLAWASDESRGMVAGTPMYMSPEQTRGEKLDVRSDLFSLGSVLYTMAVGHPAFVAKRTNAVLKRVAEEIPRPISGLNPEIPDWLAKVIEKLLAKDPRHRFQTALELSAALERGVEHEAVRHRTRLRQRQLRLASCLLCVVMLVRATLQAVTPSKQTATEKIPVGTTKPRLDSREFEFDQTGRHCRPQFSQNGRLVAASVSASVTVFDATSGEVLKKITGQNAEVRGVALSPDGRRLAVFSRAPGRIQVWDLTTETILFAREADETTDNEPLFSPDGKWLVLAENHPVSRLHILDAYSGDDIRALPTTTWNGGSFDPSGRRFAASFSQPSGVASAHSDQDKVTVWDTSDWHEITTLTHPPPRTGDHGHRGWAKYSPMGKYLAANGNSGVTIWTADRHEFVSTIKTDCFWFDFLSDEETLLVKGSDGFETAFQFSRFDIRSGANQGEFWVRGPYDYIHASLNASREYLFVASYSSESRLRVFHALTGREFYPTDDSKIPAEAP